MHERVPYCRIATATVTALVHLLFWLTLLSCTPSVRASDSSAMSSCSADSASPSRPFVTLPAVGPHSATLIFLHGLGDTAEGGWREVLPLFQRTVPGLKIILPTAPSRAVSISGGQIMPAWYDIAAFNTHSTSNFDGIDETQSLIAALVRDEIRSSGLSSRRVLIGGFSQGGGASLFSGHAFDQPLGGIFSMSSRLPFVGSADDFKRRVLHVANANTPTLMVHGEADRIVAMSVGESSFQTLKQARATSANSLQWKSYKHLGHQSNDEELRFVSEWIKEQLTTQQ